MSPRAQTITVMSEAFEDGAAIPKRYACDGEDVSLPLRCTGVPEAMAELARIADDPDAPGGYLRALGALRCPGRRDRAGGEDGPGRCRGGRQRLRSERVGRAMPAAGPRDAPLRLPHLCPLEGARAARGSDRGTGPGRHPGVGGRGGNPHGTLRPLMLHGAARNRVGLEAARLEYGSTSQTRRFDSLVTLFWRRDMGQSLLGPRTRLPFGDPYAGPCSRLLAAVGDRRSDPPSLRHGWSP
jgi:hypothetical protein